MTATFHKQYISVAGVSALIAVALYWVSLPVWGRYVAAVGYESLAAFIAILCIASLLLHQRGDSSSAPILLAAGFAYYTVIELGGAIEKLLLATSPLFQKTSIVLASDLLEMSILGTVFILALFLHQRGLVSNDRRRNMFFILLFLGPLLLNGIIRFSLLKELSIDIVNIIGVSAGVSSIILMIGTGLIIVRNRSLFPLNGPIRIPVACTFLGMSSLPSMIALFIPGAIWTLAIILQLIAFIIIYLALAPTFLGKFDIPKRPAFNFILTIMILMVVPFLIILLTESIMPEIVFENIGAYTVAAFGSTSMSAALAGLIYTYAKRTDKRYLYPIAFVFSIWTVVGLTNMLLAPLLPFIEAESSSSLILVTLLSMPALFQSIKWMDSRSSDEDNRSLKKWIVFGFVGGASLVVIGEIIQSIVLTSNPPLDSEPYGGCVVLALNAIVIGEFVYLTFLLVTRSHGQVTIESLSVGFLSLWILQNVLKAIFSEWTMGWWLSEIMLLIGLLAGPTIMGYLYLGSFLRAEESGTRAKVYADVLAHDISNHHQAILNSLEIALMEITPEDMRIRVLGEAQRALADADGLAKNVRKLGQIENMEVSNLQPMDLVISISDSFNRLTKAMRAPDITLNLDKAEGECFILANDLLHDVFLNLIRNAIEYSGTRKVDVVISAIHKNNKDHWEVRVIDYGPGILYEKRALLFERYMKGAKGSGLGLSVVKALTELFHGTVRIEDRVIGDYSQGSAFVLLFPAINSLHDFQ